MPKKKLAIKEPSEPKVSKIGLVKKSDLIKLIRVCSKSGVSELTLEGIQIKFGAVDQRNPKQLTTQTRVSEKEAIENIERAEKQMTFELAEQTLDELRLSDPLAYEKLIEREIGDAGGVQTA